MKIGPKNARFVQTLNALPDEFIDTLEADEAELLREVTPREDTVTIYIVDLDNNSLAGYVCFGMDGSDMLTVYAAHSFIKGLGQMAFQGLFGVAKVVEKPLRVHTSKIRTFARAIGADEWLEAVDADGLPMGVFNG